MRIRGSSNGLLKAASAAAPFSVLYFRLKACKPSATPVAQNLLLNTAVYGMLLGPKGPLNKCNACCTEAPLNISVLYFRLKACLLSSAPAEQRILWGWGL